MKELCQASSATDLSYVGIVSVKNACCMDSNRALHDYLAMDYYPYNRKILKACGLTRLPDRRRFDRRLSMISIDIKEKIAAMRICL
jgi:hypothetical protein